MKPTSLRGIGRVLLVYLATALFLCFPDAAFAEGDSATRFNVFVPPNNNNSARRSMLIVTNVSGVSNLVNIVDDAADGDSDDSASNVMLARGQSYLVQLSDGAVNDDVGGKVDGDFFKISAVHPIAVQMATKSNWQHDWAAGEGGGGVGRSFFLYAPPTSGADNDLNVFAYFDHTRITVTDVSVTPRTSTGATSVNLNAGALVLDVELQQGEDLIVRRLGLGLDIFSPGRTYWIQATEPVSVQYGHLGQLTGISQARDGGGYVPSVNGTSSGSLYYFYIPHDPGREVEKELRVVCFDEGATVRLYGANSFDTGWTQIDSQLVHAGGHLDYVGATNATFRGKELYKLTVEPPYLSCNVFEANWIETGSPGTSDFGSAVSGLGGRGLSNRFVTYIGPPGYQDGVVNPIGEATNQISTQSGLTSHLYVMATEPGTQVTVQDSDTAGATLTRVFDVAEDSYYDFVIDLATYNSLKANGRRPYVSLASSKPVTVVNGNFNDNWMTSFHSVAEPKLQASVNSTQASVSCGDTVGLELRCDNVSNSGSAELAISLSIPSGLTVVDADGASAGTNGLSWAGTTVPYAEGRSHAVTLRNDCTSVGQPLVALTLECATVETKPVSRLASTNIQLLAPTQPTTSAFAAVDVPDYLSSTPSPRVHVSATISAGSADVSVRLLRAVNDGDPTATQVVLSTQVVRAGTAPLSLSVDDPYVLHYEETRFYRLELTASSVTTRLGPLAVRTSSGGSSGQTGGLESNGRMANALARRAVLQQIDRRREALGVFKQALNTPNELTSLLPDVGPAGSLRHDVTPADLPQLTNATRVLAADYLRDDGSKAASALIIETVGETYEHNKALCDRALGGVLGSISRVEFDQGSLLRALVSNERQATGEAFSEFKVYAESNDTYRAESNWLRENYSQPRDGQRVLNIQVWSAVLGYELTLAQQITDALGASLPEGSAGPAQYFSRARTLGGRLELALAEATVGDGTRLRLTSAMDDGSERVREYPLEATAEVVDVTGALDTTAELLTTDGKVVDRVWVSDGAWTYLDDARWAGSTRIDEFRATECTLPRSDTTHAGVELAGCAQLTSQVDQFGGVARHFGGGFAPLDLSTFARVELELANDRAIEMCLERAGLDASEQACLEVPAGPARTVSLALSDFRDERRCQRPLSGISVATLTTATSGGLQLQASGLRFVGSVTPGGTSVSCTATVNAGDGGGCSLQPGGTRGRPWPLSLTAINVWLWFVARRRKTASSAPPAR